MTNKFFDYINLHKGEEKGEKVLENIRANIAFKGANLWILACAIIIASVGLNVNSTAVIIGAMLISPLMGPIVGAGFALGTYNFLLLKIAIKNLIIATIVSLLVSAIYFYISPFKDVQSELLARTSPTIYDVLIAFFGGLVGVISITRVEKGNPIPGVAIATALMPPLCTAGYGLATFNLSYFFGAFYLYTINCFFICIATFFVIKYLKYPTSSTLDTQKEKRIRYGISMLILVMIIPSFYLAYTLFQEKKFTKTVEEFIDSEFTDRGYTVIYKKINYNSKPKKVELAFLDKKLTEENILLYNRLLQEKGLGEVNLTFKQDEKDIKSEILNELNRQDRSFAEKDIIINDLKRELAKYKVSEPGLVKEIGVLFPSLEQVSLGKVERNLTDTTSQVDWVLMYKDSVAPIKNSEKIRITNWLKARLQVDTVLVVNTYQPVVYTKE
ncbi:DUF389 domain-containing protein [Myroides odoratimimus]|uniref:TIGR00341 family protein n=1 Tax=Myroides odoratimimus CIP 101113 TaxID=883154 RepID=A0AAV3F1G9_9FLAO|nr:DUF389 domain-containing protein [Myroides odoratimimus]EHO09770.1 hypothetical protein HMPREF9715_02323 [Myroides odoratimimus CIP 101113]MEC4053843.1 DUF389 domain-containing protein [Myroides odoratimimus]